MTAAFGRYEPLFKLASGGMAEVHVARIRGEAGFEKLVAVKRMLPHLTEDERFVEMFLDEGRLAAHVSSPSVVQTLDLGRAADGSLYIVMELVHGVSLFTLMKQVVRAGDVVPAPIAVEILAQAAAGLDDAHEATTPTGVKLGIVHRDVSPQNVLVGVDGRARVTDFGIARAMLRRAQTSTGELKGKFSYFSPEQAEGGEVDRRTDVFALGIVAWEVLAGRRLFAGETPIESMKKVRSMAIMPPAAIRPDVPRGVSDAIMKALERDVGKRWQTAADFAQGLRAGGAATVTPREIGAFVRTMGGDQVSGLQARLDAALAAAEALTTPLLDVGVKSGGGTPVAAVHAVKTAVLTDPLDDSQTLAPVARTPTDVAPPPSRVPLVAGGIALLIVVLLVVGLVVAKPWAGSDDVVAHPITSPIVTTVPVATPFPSVVPGVASPQPPPTEPVAPTDVAQQGTTPDDDANGAHTQEPGHSGSHHRHGATQVADAQHDATPGPRDTTPAGGTQPQQQTQTPQNGRTGRNGHTGGLVGNDAFDNGI